jgi:hypothetical protein
MLNDTYTPLAGIRISVTLSPGCTADPLQAGAPSLAAFPVSRIAREPHPRVNLWAGLSEASQILAEAEAHKGAPLTQAELRALMELHLDCYDPDWSFQKQGISEEWMRGWERAFALASQHAARARCPEPPHGIGALYHPGGARGDSPAQARAASLPSVRFCQAQVLVQDPAAFFQGVWEGQMAALEERGGWKACDY